MVAVLSVRLCFWRINGKHKINILCVLCGSACPMKSPLHLFHRGGELSPLIFGTSIPARNMPKDQTVDNSTTAQKADTVNPAGNFLEKKGMVERTHGGAVFKQERLIEKFHYRSSIQENPREKRCIAACAATMIAPNDTIYIGEGFT